MAKEYKIAKVSPTTKQWTSKFGEMISYYVLFEGEGQEPIQINKKPESKPPQPGEVLYGTLSDNGSFGGMKFKAEMRQDGAAPGTAARSYQKDDGEIRALAIVKAAAEYCGSSGKEVTDIQAAAEALYNAYVVIKAKDTLTTAEPPKEAVEVEKALDSDKPVDLSTIPF